jgi:hypothetical protein
MENSITILAGNSLVNRILRECIWPLLKEHGFATFTQRTSWRHTADRIDVVDFRPVGADRAHVLGCTPFSFSINLGIFFLAIPPQFGPDSIKRRVNVLLPQESLCHFRHPLTKARLDAEGTRPDIWYIDPQGSNAMAVVQEAATDLVQQAIPWFARYSAPNTALHILLNDDENFATVWGFGRNPSPIRHYLTGYMALAQRQYELAMIHLKAALDTGIFEATQVQLLHDVETSARYQLHRPTP